VAACSNAPTLAPPSSPPSAPGPTTTPTPTAFATPAVAPVPSALASPPSGVDPATALEIAAPYELVEPSASDYGQLSGNIRGLSDDLAEAAGGGPAPAHFPLGFRFIRNAGRDVGLLAVLGMPADVVALPGMLEAVAPAVAAEVNALLSYETVDGVKVGILKGPIASALAIVDGHLVMAQSGQPAVKPIDLMTAVIAASDAGSTD
jgi:hypothetical protein